MPTAVQKATHNLCWSYVLRLLAHEPDEVRQYVYLHLKNDCAHALAMMGKEVPDE